VRYPALLADHANRLQAGSAALRSVELVDHAPSAAECSLCAEARRGGRMSALGTPTIYYAAARVPFSCPRFL